MQNIVKAWREKQSKEEVTSIFRFPGGQTNDTFLVNGKTVIKVYKNESKYKNTKSLQSFTQDFVPKIYNCFDNIDILHAPVIVMEYIDGKPLTEVFYEYSHEKKEAISEKIGLMLSKVHQFDVQNISYNTEKLFTDTYTLFAKAKAGGLMSINQISVISQFLESYKPINKSVIGCRIHGDMHIENILALNNGELYIIDRDCSQINHPVMECGMLIEQSIIPLGVVAENLESHYPHGYCIDMLHTINKAYPSLFTEERKDEILLQGIQRLLYKYSVDPNMAGVDKAIGMGKAIYDEIFINGIIDTLINT